MTKPNEWEEETRKELKRKLTEAYFAFSKVKKPDFKTVDEGKNWYDQQNFIAEKMVGSWVDNVMVTISQAILSAEKRAKRKAKEEVITDLILGKGNPEYWPDYFPVSKAFKKAYGKFMEPVDYSSSLPDQEQLLSK